MGWARIGQRARRHDYFVRGQRLVLFHGVSRNLHHILTEFVDTLFYPQSRSMVSSIWTS